MKKESISKIEKMESNLTLDPKIISTIYSAVSLFFKEISSKLADVKIIVSEGHQRGVDPGCVNTHTNDSQHFQTEIDANESMVVRLLNRFAKAGKDTSLLLKSGLSLGSYISAVNSIFNSTTRALAIEFHHDMSIPLTHILYYKKKIIIYYGGAQAYKSALFIKQFIQEEDDSIIVDVLHHTVNKRIRLGFIRRTLHPAIIVETGFISQDVSLINELQDRMIDALLKFCDNES